MIPVSFSYHRAESLQDAIARISGNPEAKILAGGHSLIPAMKLRLAAPGELVDISGLDALKSVEIGDDIKIGAMVTYRTLQYHDGLQSVAPVFSEAIPLIADRQVRGRGTLGGSLAHADPAADLTGVFLAMNGSVEAEGPSGVREIAADDFFVDLWTTALEPDEVLTTIHLPIPSASTRMTYVKHPHPASGYAVVGIAVVIGEKETRVVVTGATSKPERLRGAEEALTAGLSEESINNAMTHAVDGIIINGDLYADEEYRAHLVRQMVGQALRKLM